MFELIALAAFILALSAYLGNRRTTERLGTELAALKAEVVALKAAPGEAPRLKRRPRRLRLRMSCRPCRRRRS